jgi:hypothetical protein
VSIVGGAGWHGCPGSRSALWTSFVPWFAPWRQLLGKTVELVLAMLGVIAVAFQGRRHLNARRILGHALLGSITVDPRAPLRSGRMAQLEVTKALPGTKPLAPAGGRGR